MLRLLVLSFALAGCAAPPRATAPAGHPATASVEAPAPRLLAVDLAPAPEARLPAPLCPDGVPPAGSQAGRDPHAGHPAASMEPMSVADAATSHTARHHMASDVGDRNDVPPGGVDVRGASHPQLPAVLDAYLAVHAALVDGQADAADAPAATLRAALDALVAAPPAQDTHFWHSRSAEVEAARGAAVALDTAADLGAARVAFGRLSVPLAAWIDALGTPPGYDLARFTCGMYRDAPEGGVWMQRAGETRNPFYGTAMLSCGRQTGVPGQKASPSDSHREGHHDQP